MHYCFGGGAFFYGGDMRMSMPMQRMDGAAAWLREDGKEEGSIISY